MASRPAEPSKRASSSFVHTLTEASRGRRQPIRDALCGAHLGLAQLFDQGVECALGNDPVLDLARGSITRSGQVEQVAHAAIAGQHGLFGAGLAHHAQLRARQCDESEQYKSFVAALRCSGRSSMAKRNRATSRDRTDSVRFCDRCFSPRGLEALGATPEASTTSMAKEMASSLMCEVTAGIGPARRSSALRSRAGARSAALHAVLAST